MPAAECQRGRSIEFLVQAVNGVGLVSLDDNLGRTVHRPRIGQTATRRSRSRAPRYQDARRSRLHGDGGRVFGPAGDAHRRRRVHGGGRQRCTSRPSATARITGDAGGQRRLQRSQRPRRRSRSIWPFTGFFSPVDNLPALNTATAGCAIPVKFRLGGNRGLGDLRAELPGPTRSRAIPTRPTRSRRPRPRPQRPHVRRRLEPVQVHLEDAEDLRGLVLPAGRQADRRHAPTARTSSSSSPGRPGRAPRASGGPHREPAWPGRCSQCGSIRGGPSTSKTPT